MNHHMSQRQQRKWDRWKDLATPREREWLDKMERFCNYKPLKIISRHGPKDGQFNGITTPLHSGGGFGCYAQGLDWVKQEVRKERRRRARFERAEVRRSIGSCI